MPDARVQIDGTMVLAGVAVVGVGLAWWWRERLVKAVNPADRDNVINQGAMHVYRDLTGSTGTIGGDFYDLTHTDEGEFAPTAWLRGLWPADPDDTNDTEAEPEPNPHPPLFGAPSDAPRDHIPWVLY